MIYSVCAQISVTLFSLNSEPCACRNVGTPSASSSHLWQSLHSSVMEQRFELEPKR